MALDEREIAKTHHPHEALHSDALEWQMARFPGQSTKMMFRPRPERPTEPNAGLVRYDPGATHPLHAHDFAQVWYVLEGECRFGDRTLTEGDMVYMEDPHFEYEMHTEHGGTILFVQYPGPTTGAAPLYDGRMNLSRKETEEELNLRL